MNTDYEQELAANLAAKLADHKKDFEHKEFLALQTLKEEVDKENIIHLDEDEERLLKAYRLFKARSKSESVFQWRVPQSEGLVFPSEPSLLVDPREVIVKEFLHGTQSTSY